MSIQRYLFILGYKVMVFLLITSGVPLFCTIRGDLVALRQRLHDLDRAFKPSRPGKIQQARQQLEDLENKLNEIITSFEAGAYTKELLDKYAQFFAQYRPLLARLAKIDKPFYDQRMKEYYTIYEQWKAQLPEYYKALRTAQPPVALHPVGAPRPSFVIEHPVVIGESIHKGPIQAIYGLAAAGQPGRETYSLLVWGPEVNPTTPISEFFNGGGNFVFPINRAAMQPAGAGYKVLKTGVFVLKDPSQELSTTQAKQAREYITALRKEFQDTIENSPLFDPDMHKQINNLETAVPRVAEFIQNRILIPLERADSPLFINKLVQEPSVAEVIDGLAPLYRWSRDLMQRIARTIAQMAGEYRSIPPAQQQLRPSKEKKERINRYEKVLSTLTKALVPFEQLLKRMEEAATHQEEHPVNRLYQRLLEELKQRMEHEAKAQAEASMKEKMRQRIEQLRREDEQRKKRKSEQLRPEEEWGN